jgi:3-phenylpropionate/trans-cinnamate dioxygenase ferredoxin subunit
VTSPDQEEPLATDEVEIAGGDAIPEGEIVAFTIGGRAVAVARSESKLYAFDDRCTHEECPLSTGWVEDNEIECERHGARFALATGAVTLPPAFEPLVTHVVSERNGKVYVSLSEAAAATD